MKIRNGFVSNSSSASFVIVGVKLTKKEYESRFGDEDGYEKVKEAKLDCVWEENIVGKFLALMSSDNYEMEEKQYTLTEISAIAFNVTEALKVPSNRVKIYTGVMST